MNKRLWQMWSVLAIAAMIVAACAAPATTAAPTPMPPTQAPPPTAAPPAAPAIDCQGAKSGDAVTLFYVWAGAEEENLNKILKPLVDECGLKITAESSRDQAVLDTRVQAGTPFDVVIWPTTGIISQYADKLVPLDQAGAHRENYADYWVDLGSGSDWYAVPVKADIKTIIWYSPAIFEAKGYTLPKTFEELNALVEQMVKNGDVPWSMGMESGDATGWTGSDFIQDLLLVKQGPGYVLDLLDGSIAYNDAGVKEAYEIYGKWASSAKYTVGGAKGTLSVSFLDAILKPFSDPPEAMMVKQSGFAGGVVADQFPDLKYGEDYDFFAFPGAQGMQGGADWLMAFNASPAAKALIAYLTSEAGAQQWASVGFDLSPNKKAVGAYADAALAKKAEALAGAAGFTPDIGDTIPGGFGKAEWTAIVDYLGGADVESALADAAAVQAQALGVKPPAALIDCQGAKSGDAVTMFYVWSGAEEENLNKILKPLVDKCGLKIAAESSRDQAVLDTRVQAGTPFDVVIWPTTGIVSQYADKLVALDAAGAHANNYAGYWKELGASGGKWYAVPVKADIKTIIWYSPAVFEAKGYAVPKTFEELDALVEQMVKNGDVPWSMGMESGDATGWTGSDFIQDLMLVQQGPQYVLDLISGKVAYDDAGVKQAYETYVKWASDEKYTVGGANGTLSIGFLDAILKPFSDPPEAMMVKQSGFAGGVVAEQFPDLKYGEDYDFFAFPGAQGMQGGADWLMAFNASPAAKAVIAYLTSGPGAREWAKAGFDLSPNRKAAGAYADAALAKKGEALAGAAGFTPDIGDTIPGGFGKAEWTAIVDAVGGGDLGAALAAAAKVQAEATK